MNCTKSLFSVSRLALSYLLSLVNVSAVISKIVSKILEMASWTTTRNAVIIGYLVLQNTIPFPPFHPGEEILKIMSHDKKRKLHQLSQSEGIFAQLSTLLLGKLADSALSYNTYNYLFFKLIVVPLPTKERLYWLGVLGCYYFIFNREDRV